jgi:phenylacetic acid degradation operon negative regulatory protein
MLLTVVGEMLRDREQGAWTVAMLRVLGGLGIEDHAARQLLARSAAAGWVEREREGRAVRWRLAAAGRALVEEGLRRSATYLEGDDAWDGRWLVLHVTVPQHQRTTRKRLYGGLTWLGMGNPTPGVWVTPHAERIGELDRLISSLDLDDTALSFVGPASGVGIAEDVMVQRSWNLSDLEKSYRRFIAQESTAQDAPDRDALMLSYLDLLNLQQRFMRLDPQLPVELLPSWVGRDAAELFATLRSRWGATAHARFWEIVDASAPV